MKLITKVSNPDELRAYLTEQIPSFSYSHSYYTKSRLEKWLFYQPKRLNLPEVIEAPIDFRLYNFAKEINPNLNVGLITLNSAKHKSCGLIKTHRDATYASPIAYLVNIGRATFKYDGTPYDLADGGIYKFNCKMPHSVEYCSDMRFSIVFWQLKPYIKLSCDVLEDRIARMLF